MSDSEPAANITDEQKEMAKGAGDPVQEATEKESDTAPVDSTANGTEKQRETVTEKQTEVVAASTTGDQSEPTVLESKIIRQVEYYFGDANLDRDKFLKEEMKKDDGWVTLKVLLTFNRLKAMSDDAAVIMAALRKSTNDLLELKSDDSAIRRHPTRPLPSSDDKQDIQNRLLYVKGFPTDETLDNLIEYFDKYGVESVAQRRDIKREFKGSVFIRFKTEEQAKEYMEPKEMKYKDTHDLLRMHKHDYFKMKQNARLGDKQEEVKKKEDMKKKKEQEEKEEFESRITRGALLKVTGVDSDGPIEKLKEFFGTFGKVAWVDHVRGEDLAIVRFASENGAKTAWEKAVEAGTDGKVISNEKELSATFLEGEEEERHWRKVFESMRNKHQHKGSKKFGRGGGQRGGGQRGGHRGGFKRRNTGGEGGGSGAKKAKAEDG